MTIRDSGIFGSITLSPSLTRVNSILRSFVCPALKMGWLTLNPAQRLPAFFWSAVPSLAAARAAWAASSGRDLSPAGLSPRLLSHQLSPASLASRT